MCPLDIEEHFFLAPTPVFQVNGKSYTVRTRFGKAMLYADQLHGAWRPAIIQEMVWRIKRDEEFQQKTRGQPDARYWVHSVFLNPTPIIDPNYQPYHTAIWRAALVL